MIKKNSELLIIYKKKKQKAKSKNLPFVYFLLTIIGFLKKI
jgi:hypothetical protein